MLIVVWFPAQPPPRSNPASKNSTGAVPRRPTCPVERSQVAIRSSKCRYGFEPKPTVVLPIPTPFGEHTSKYRVHFHRKTRQVWCPGRFLALVSFDERRVPGHTTGTNCQDSEFPPGQHTEWDHRESLRRPFCSTVSCGTLPRREVEIMNNQWAVHVPAGPFLRPNYSFNATVVTGSICNMSLNVSTHVSSTLLPTLVTQPVRKPAQRLNVSLLFLSNACWEMDDSRLLVNIM